MTKTRNLFTIPAVIAVLGLLCAAGFLTLSVRTAGASTGVGASTAASGTNTLSHEADATPAPPPPEPPSPQPQPSAKPSAQTLQMMGSAPEGIADASVARIRAVEGSSTIERYQEESKALSSVNAPVYPGDSVTTSANGRVEVQLAGGALVRLDHGTKLAFVSMPGTDLSRDAGTLLQLSSGSIEVEIRDIDQGEFRIDAPASAIDLLSPGRYRLDLTDKASRVSSYRGNASVAGKTKTVVVHGGQRTTTGKGGEPEAPAAFNTLTADSFDAWVDQRNQRYVRAAEAEPPTIDQEQIPGDVRPYQHELDSYGTWKDTEDYGPVWVPTDQPDSWTPYSNGYWDNGPYGAFWVSYDPWGWAPYHYGRWGFTIGLGWYWCPGAVFSPAWVSWYYGPSYIGWCPLNYWNYPCWSGVGYWGWSWNYWSYLPWGNFYCNGPYYPPHPAQGPWPHDGGGGVVTNRPVPFGTNNGRARTDPSQVIGTARAHGGAVPFGQAAPTSASAPQGFRARESQQLANRNPGAAGTGGSRASSAGGGSRSFGSPNASGFANTGAGSRGASGIGAGSSGANTSSFSGQSEAFNQRPSSAYGQTRGGAASSGTRPRPATNQYYHPRAYDPRYTSTDRMTRATQRGDQQAPYRHYGSNMSNAPGADRQTPWWNQQHTMTSRTPRQGGSAPPRGYAYSGAGTRYSGSSPSYGHGYSGGPRMGSYGGGAPRSGTSGSMGHAGVSGGGPRMGSSGGGFHAGGSSGGAHMGGGGGHAGGGGGHAGGGGGGFHGGGGHRGR